MRYLLECWNDIAQRLRDAGAIALFLDFDGTLAPLRASPEEACLPWPTRRVLQRLTGRPRLRICVISGRRQSDVRERVGVRGIHCIGLYGLEDGRAKTPREDTLQILAQARHMVEKEVPRITGVRLEDKGAAFVLHYRGAPAGSNRRAAGLLTDVLAHFGRRLAVMAGDHVWEVIPRGLRGKGFAARRHWRLTGRGSLPIYIGDDAADESAFAALSSGITACVGPARATRARFLLRNPAEVRTFLERLDREAR